MNKGWKIFGCVLLGVAFVLTLGWLTMILWNWLVPVLFSGPVLTFSQALALLVLSKILFGFGFGRGNGHANHCNGTSAWKGNMYQKFSNMSPEDRESFKNKMKEKWCRYEQAQENKDNTNG
jgi:hypothetical protein